MSLRRVCGVPLRWAFAGWHRGQEGYSRMVTGGAGLAPADAHAVRQPTLLELMSLADWPRFVPETLGLLVVISLLRTVMSDGSMAAVGMPHPFWIPVLLMSAQYGIMGGLFAVLAAAGAFLAFELPAPSATQDYYDYAAVAAAQPCAWFAAALVLGGLRTLHMHHEAALNEQLDETKAAADDVAERLDDAVAEISRLERRIATQTATPAAFLDAVAGIDLTSRAALLASAPAFVCLATGFRTARLYTHSSAAPQVMPESVRAPIRHAEGAEAIAWVVCADPENVEDAALVAHRLDKVCHVLGKLLAASTETADASRT